MVELTSGDFRKMLISGAKLLEINRPLVDSLNVSLFPTGIPARICPLLSVWRCRNSGN